MTRFIISSKETETLAKTYGDGAANNNAILEKLGLIFALTQGEHNLNYKTLFKPKSKVGKGY